MYIPPKRPLPLLRIDQLGSSHGTDDQVRRTVRGISGPLKNDVGKLDLTNVRPSELNPIAARLCEEGKITEDVASKLMLLRAPGARGLTDNRPFNLIEATKRVARMVGALSPMHAAAGQQGGYTSALYCAKGLTTVINALKTGTNFDAEA
ncbi:hypothetical protein [Luteibacter yeojuensis]|uniref:Uncharacterized protein n=1 Tax=Luteibacter yeojuensis TaxID=345309 RepID=A0A0F3KVN1_9GAMM|nr:hypothetical protein [Luteibacter yeojuensis]KJV35325.1 hypothetical protein VI08_08545 [Luteibacter yeojuensis]